jgi:uncharacterized membrane protein
MMPWMFGDHWSSWADGGFFGLLFGGVQMLLMWLVPVAVLAFVVWLVIQATQNRERQLPPPPAGATSYALPAPYAPTTPPSPRAPTHSNPVEQTGPAVSQQTDAPLNPSGSVMAEAAAEPAQPITPARAILDERYARGEIDREEYLQRRADLSS